jgi:DNA-binding response OmpR family regulator
MKNRILLLNEDPAVRRMIFRVLTGEDYSVITAGLDLNSTKSTLVSDFPKVDLILLDLDVEDEHAWALLERLGSSSACPPTIIMTDRPDKLVSKGHTVSAVLEKPLDLPKLLQTIRDLLSPSATKSEPQRLTPSLKP